MKVIGYLILLILLWISSILASLFFPIQLFFWKSGKEYARAIDQLVNAAFFRGEGRESLSSHAWRSNIRPIIWLTNLVEQDHCKEANKHEQPIVDFINEQ